MKIFIRKKKQKKHEQKKLTKKKIVVEIWKHKLYIICNRQWYTLMVIRARHGEVVLFVFLWLIFIFIYSSCLSYLEKQKVEIFFTETEETDRE